MRACHTAGASRGQDGCALDEACLEYERPRFGLLGRFAQATTTRGAIVHTDAWNGYAGL
jgi:hypothetical protein